MMHQMLIPSESGQRRVSSKQRILQPSGCYKTEVREKICEFGMWIFSCWRSKVICNNEELYKPLSIRHFLILLLWHLVQIQGRENSTVVSVSVCQAGGLGSRPARSACHRKVRFYHCVIDSFPPVLQKRPSMCYYVCEIMHVKDP